MMVLHYVQLMGYAPILEFSDADANFVPPEEPPTLQTPPDLPHALVEFFQYWTFFDYGRFAVSPRMGRLVMKVSRL